MCLSGLAVQKQAGQGALRSVKQVGCPESGIDEAIRQLTSAGYKVGRIEQTETAAEAKKKRGNKVPATCIAFT